MEHLPTFQFWKFELNFSFVLYLFLAIAIFELFAHIKAILFVKIITYFYSTIMIVSFEDFIFTLYILLKFSFSLTFIYQITFSLTIVNFYIFCHLGQTFVHLSYTFFILPAYYFSFLFSIQIIYFVIIFIFKTIDVLS